MDPQDNFKDSLKEKHAERFKATWLAVGATVCLTIVKLVTGVITGSIGVISEAIHSGLDLISSLVTFFTVRASVKPADENHPFGHGKIENLSALLEALLLIFAAGYIAQESIDRWNTNAEVQHVNWALIVLGFSVVLNLAVYIQNRNVGRRVDSVAIETNAYHFLADVYSSLMVFIGMALLQFTGWNWLDPLIALIISGYITIIAIMQMKKSIDVLSDVTLPQEELTEIEEIINQHKKDFIGFHDLRSRKAGSTRYIDFHLQVCSDESVASAHQTCDRIEADLEKKFEHIHVNIHVEPCDNHQKGCDSICKFKGMNRRS